MATKIIRTEKRQNGKQRKTFATVVCDVCGGEMTDSVWRVTRRPCMHCAKKERDLDRQNMQTEGLVLLRTWKRERSRNTVKQGGHEWWGRFMCPVCCDEFDMALHHGKKMEMCGKCSRKRRADAKPVEIDVPHMNKHGKIIERHGKTGTPLYFTWNSMRNRCLNSNHPKYHRYGGRGITIHPQWLYSFLAFEAWAVGNGYKKGLTIDRIDNEGDYVPTNCQFITREKNTKKMAKDNISKANKELDCCGLF